MKTMKHLGIAILLAPILAFSLSFAQEAVSPKSHIPTVKKVAGDCLLKSQAPPNPGRWVRIHRPGSELRSGDELLVRSGEMEILLCPKTTVNLDTGCSATLEECRGRVRPFTFILPDIPQRKLKIAKGSLQAEICPYEISNFYVFFETPSANIVARGTKLTLTVGDDGRVRINSEEGTLESSDPSGSFLYTIPGGAEVRTLARPDGTVLIESIRGAISAFSPESNLLIPAGGSVELQFDPRGLTTVSVPANAAGPVRVETGRVNTIINPGQSARIALLAGGWASVESLGEGPITASFFQTLVRLARGDAASFYFDPETLEIKVLAESGCPLVIRHDGEMITVCAGQDIGDIAILVPGMGFLPVEITYEPSPYGP